MLSSPGPCNALPRHLQTLAYQIFNPVGLEYTIVTVTCYFSLRRGAVRLRSGTHG